MNTMIEGKKDSLETDAMDAVSSSPAIVQFQFQQHQIRVLTIDGEPWFVAKDVCHALGLAWNSETRRAIPKRWRGRTEDHRRIISEAAIYKLAFRADKPAFIEWMEAEVLPAINNQSGVASALVPVSPDYREQCEKVTKQMLALQLDLARAAYEMRMIFSSPFCRGLGSQTHESQKPFAHAMNYAIDAHALAIAKDIEALALLFTAYVEGEKLMGIPSTSRSGKEVEA